MKSFKLKSEFSPAGDQPQAIDKITRYLRDKHRECTLLGVTGSGKTFTMAHTIQNLQKPTLILAPNKTLAAQLYSEFKDLFPENAVEYFVSYYDYYQPEAYVAASDTYIEKDSSINDHIDQMRHSATRSLLSRSDVIIVASVSCIYGLGSPESYYQMLIQVTRGQKIERDAILLKLIDNQYDRAEGDIERGKFRVLGDVIEVYPTYSDWEAYRLSFWGSEIESIEGFDPLSGMKTRELENFDIFPSSHFVMPKETVKKAIREIQNDLRVRIQDLRKINKLVEAERIETRTYYDIEMMEELGYCQGIENYSRYFTQRKTGQPPPTLIDYFPDEFMIFVDESHVTIPQIGGMYRGDRARKMNLVEHGFRLPSALDNRPLNFSEFEALVHQIVYVSATPGPYEMKHSKQRVIEQVIRPTGLCDPEIDIRPTLGCVDDLFLEIKKRIKKNQRVLVTTLTKKMAEDLSEYYKEMKCQVEYLHADVNALERIEIIKRLRAGEIDILIGINLLREGLDIPECSLVAILDADKQGFLRSQTSLIQTIGRAARNIDGRVIMYADKMTEAMNKAISETDRRRNKQIVYNETHNITPRGVQKKLTPSLKPADMETADLSQLSYREIKHLIDDLENQMKVYAKDLNFEKAAEVRDKILKIKKNQLGVD